LDLTPGANLEEVAMDCCEELSQARRHLQELAEVYLLKEPVYSSNPATILLAPTSARGSVSVIPTDSRRLVHQGELAGLGYESSLLIPEKPVLLDQSTGDEVAGELAEEQSPVFGDPDVDGQF
jgi:hypothetical protein